MFAQKQDTPIIVDCKVECRENKLDGIPIPLPDGIPITLPDMRLEKRYIGLVEGHMQHTKSTAAGVAVPADIENSFAVTQTTWRFFAKERVTPQALVEPLRVFAAGQLKQQIVSQQIVGMPVLAVATYAENIKHKSHDNPLFHTSS